MALSKRSYFSKTLKEAMSHADMAIGRKNIPGMGNSQFKGPEGAVYLFEDPRGSQCGYSGVRGGEGDEVNEVRGRWKAWLDHTGTCRPLLGLGLFRLEKVSMQVVPHWRCKPMYNRAVVQQELSNCHNSDRTIPR